MRRVAQVCGRLRPPASRQLLVALARQPSLFRREAALRALRHFDVVPHEVPLFQALVHDELLLAQQLLHGQTTATPELFGCLDYELTRTQQRIFALLGQIYSPRLIADAQRGVAHAARERQANALEILDNSIARPTYQGLQALLAVAPPTEKERTFDRLLGPLLAPTPLVETIVEHGETAFSDWTVRVALDEWQPAAGTVPALSPHLRGPSPLVRESAFAQLARLATTQPTLYQQVNTAHQTLATLLMSHAATTSHTPPPSACRCFSRRPSLPKRLKTYSAASCRL